MAEEHQASNDDGLVQQLFERHLGPPKTLPEVLNASSLTAKWREAEEVRFKVARGRALDYQAVPAKGALLGLLFQPARQPPHSAQHKGQPESAAQPAHSTVWALVQPNAALGINTSLSAVDASGSAGSGFAGWAQEGFVDATPRASLEYSLTRHPASGLAGEVDLVATLPKLPMLPQATARHRVAAAQATPGWRHSSSLAVPLLGGRAAAKLRIQEQASGAGGSTVSLEVDGRSMQSRGLAGGVKLSPALTAAFSGIGTSDAASCPAASESDDEPGSSSGSGSGGGAAGGEGCGRRQFRHQLPGLRLQVHPSAAGSWAGVSGRWQQPWGSRLKSTLGYQAQQRRWSLGLCQKRGNVTASGSLAWEDPGGAGPPAAAAASAAGAEGESAGSGRLRQLRSRLGSYSAGSKLHRASLRLAFRLPRHAAGPSEGNQQRRMLQLETAYDADTGVATHGLKLRLGGKGGGDALQQQRRYDLGAQLRPHLRQLDLTFDFFSPM